MFPWWYPFGTHDPEKNWEIPGPVNIQKAMEHGDSIRGFSQL